MIRVLTDADLSKEEASRVHVLFAGGICDGLGGAMVSALGQPLAEKGMKIGVLLGTAYLFTDEAIKTGAILEKYQRVALDTVGTVVVETGPGHAVRCAPNPYTDAFEVQKAQLERQGKSAEEVREQLDLANIGRLRIASKGTKHAAHQLHTVDRSLDRLSEDEQFRDGMYMIGQVAPLCGARCSIEQLHERVCDGTTVQLALADTEFAPAKPPATVRPSPPPLNIAIVGMSCLLPGAETPSEFWQNILEKRDLIEQVPADRFDIDRWYDPHQGTRDKIHVASGGFLKDIPFDPLKFGIPPTSLRNIEPVQLLALELVDRALRDVGYGGWRNENPLKEHTSIILGSGGGGSELSTKYVLRASLPQYFRELDESLLSELPEWTEDSFAGILVNVIAGRIANRFDLGGVNFTVDAACASSLAAVYLACRELADGTSDLVIAGGCDASQTPFGYFCFSSAGALSTRGKSRTFDASADGIAISEGLAAVVLKRVEDAERDGDRIYAVIRAVAGGSDGRSMGMTAPSSEGQARTLRRAYEQARFSPASVELFEAHGTGTAVGDATECQALAKLLREHGAPSRRSAIGSVKSNIGHTKCTAGVAGMIKAALALHHHVLPPTTNVESLDPGGPLVDGPLYANTELRPWVRSDSPRRAGVSAFGFGGTNFHAVLEDYEGHALEARAVNPHRRWPAELFLFAGKSRSELVDHVRRIRGDVEAAGAAGAKMALADVAFTLHGRVDRRATVKAAVVASSVDDLVERLAVLSQELSAPGASRPTLPEGVYFVENPLAAGASLAMLFPGQGSQSPNMLRDLAVEFSECRGCFDRVDAIVQGDFDRPLSRFVFPVPAFSPEEKSSQVELLKATAVAQPALGASMLAVLRLLESLEIGAQFTGGHSYGELVALHAAGSLDESSLGHLSRVRGRAMAEIGRGRNDRDLGSMVAVSGDEHAIRSLIERCEDVSVANLNSPRQTVISGSTPGLARAVDVLEAAGLSCLPIPVACAFHTSVMEPAKKVLEEALHDTVVRSPRIPVFANSSAS
ncbi:MAG: beta-ketoacyl synthase N-terminal-like domain-containing protein, partial [Planctomycetota bacterium]